MYKLRSMIILFNNFLPQYFVIVILTIVMVWMIDRVHHCAGRKEFLYFLLNHYFHECLSETNIMIINTVTTYCMQKIFEN